VARIFDSIILAVIAIIDLLWGDYRMIMRIIDYKNIKKFNYQ
jgi:hypothetical protein